jgi:hypothetical protein
VQINYLYAYWKKKYPGAEMKEVMWLAARATTVPYWQRAMQRMKNLNEKCMDLYDESLCC